MPSIILQKIDDLMLKYRKYGELAVAITVFAFFLSMRIFIGQFMDLSIERWRFVSPAFWPGLILLFGAILSAVFVYNAFQKLRLEQEAEQTKEQPELESSDHETLLRDKFQKEGVRLSLKELEALAEAKMRRDEAQSTSKELIRMIGTIGLVFVYLYLIRFMGFISSTLVFSFFYLVLLKERRPLLLAIAPLALVAVIYLIFTQLLVVPLPRGVGIFHSISGFFY